MPVRQTSPPSFDASALQTNFDAVMDELNRVKPAGSKGKYVRKAVVSSTMGPGVKMNEGVL